MWDPAVYGRYASERARPFVDLLARVGAERPRAVVDLGCGPGDLTRTLAARWPGARVTGIDSSADMIDRARQNQREARRGVPREGQGRRRGEAPAGGTAGEPGAEGGGERIAARPEPDTVDFRIGDVRDWRPDADVDVLVSNATLQWVPGHRELLAHWAAALPPGAWIAVQVPGNFDAPSHRALRAVARSAPFADAVGDVVRETPVDDAPGYASLLVRAGAAVDAWETTYVHLLPTDDAEHPVLRWMEGTALRPVRAALDEAAYQRFRVALGERLAEAYPARDGLVSFPFRRVFVVAQTSQE